MRIEAPTTFSEDTIARLAEILADAVDGDASVGWLAPMELEEARAYFQKRAQVAGEGGTVLLLAYADDGVLAGTAQLGFAPYPNGSHRADVMKVLVHSEYRRLGIGQALMLELETHARQRDISLLVLDTLEGAPSELLYQKLGYEEAGKIPNFARINDGSLATTVYYYKILE
ncbi:MAG: GNAT family N-acetyltransferase [Chloroflexota bacterium]